jgi:hypothetical protein
MSLRRPDDHRKGKQLLAKESELAQEPKNGADARRRAVIVELGLDGRPTVTSCPPDVLVMVVEHKEVGRDTAPKRSLAAGIKGVRMETGAKAEKAAREVREGPVTFPG